MSAEDDSTLGQADEASSQSGGLKVVTVSPGSEMSQELAASHDGEKLKPGTKPPPPAAPDPYLGCTIDNRYKVEAVIGEGGMGMVYRCRHKIIDKIVAMKILRSDLAKDNEVTERFLIEAKAASSIGNEHIIDISDFGQLPDGSAYFVMEFLEGEPLSDAVDQSKPMDVARIVDIGKQLATGLAAAHEAGIVHRDLKPDNIYLVQRGQQEDFVKILDFGIAKVSGGATGKLTQAGSVFGTPHYMSPEQAAGAPVDHRGDIYSFGVILYELACGRVPFDADNFMGILTQHMYKAPVPIRNLIPDDSPADVPPGLEAIILKCLSKRAEQRYATMNELTADLGRLDSGDVPEAVPEMMERSGGFHVPTDFFNKSGPMTGPLAATPQAIPTRRPNWPLYAAIGAPILIVAGIFFFQSGDSTAQVGEAPESEAVVAGPEPSAPTDPVLEGTAETIDVESATAKAPTSEKAATQVVLAVDPIEAHAFLGDQDLGQSPVVLDVPPGETLKLTVKRRGYKDKQIEVDGTEGKLAVKLDLKPAVKWRKPAKAPAKKSKPSLGGGEIVNPWE